VEKLIAQNIRPQVTAPDRAEDLRSYIGATAFF